MLDGRRPCNRSAAAKHGNRGIALNFIQTGAGCEEVDDLSSCGGKMNRYDIGGLKLHFEIKILALKRTALKVNGNGRDFKNDND